MQKNLDQERAERNAATEFKGAVKTEKVADAQKSDGNDGDRPEEKINPDSREADNEGEDHFADSNLVKWLLSFENGPKGSIRSSRLPSR